MVSKLWSKLLQMFFCNLPPPGPSTLCHCCPNTTSRLLIFACDWVLDTWVLVSSLTVWLWVIPFSSLDFKLFICEMRILGSSLTPPLADFHFHTWKSPNSFHLPLIKLKLLFSLTGESCVLSLISHVWLRTLKAEKVIEGLHLQLGMIFLLGKGLSWSPESQLRLW